MKKKITLQASFLCLYSIVCIAILFGVQDEVLPWFGILLNFFTLMFNMMHLFLSNGLLNMPSIHGVFEGQGSNVWSLLEINISLIAMMIGFYLRTSPTKMWVPIAILISFWLIKQIIFIIYDKGVSRSE